MTFGLRVRELRHEKKLTLRELAEELETSENELLLLAEKISLQLRRRIAQHSWAN